MKNATEIFLLLDASSSMSHLQSSTIESVNSFIKDQQQIPGEAYITIAQFNHSTRIVSEGDLQSIKPINTVSYNPNGQTALADALIIHIDNLGRKLSNTPESERPDKVVFVIVTDGQENASENMMETATVKIKHQEVFYNWKFLYLAAGKEAFDQGGLMYLSPGQMLAFNPTGDSSKQLYIATSAAIGAYRSTGQHASLSFSDDSRNAILSK